MAAEENIPQPQLEEIERFLQHQMTVQEEETFKARLETDPALQEHVNEMRLLMIGIEEAALQEQLNVYHEEVPIKKMRWLNRTSWLAAASVIIIIAVSLFWLTRSPRPSRLFAEYFVPDAGLVSSMGGSDNYDFDRAMVDYKMGKYTEAITAWQSLPQSDTTRYFIGSAFLAREDADSAVVYFSKVLTDTSGTFYDDANWYMGLALLKQNKPNEAVPYINRSTRKEKDALLPKLTP